MLHSLRNDLKKLKNSTFLFKRLLFSILFILWSVIKVFIIPRYCSEKLSQIKYPKEVFQISTFTKKNRYPSLFQKISEELKLIEKPKILSFGCSTGEEVFSLKSLIPNAEITGVDINHWCIKSASKKNHFPNCFFLYSKDDKWKKENYYDCILALAVYQKTCHRNPNTTKTINSFNFSTFEESIHVLDKLLKKGGFFAIDNSDYRFEDLPIYNALYFPGFSISFSRKRPRFDRTNKKVSSTFESFRLFKKTSDSSR